MPIRRAKYKDDRRVGVNILGRTKSSFNKRPYPPGVHGKKQASHGGFARKSEYALKIIELKKLKVSFGIKRTGTLEKIFQESFRLRASQKSGLHDIFLNQLERRLQSLVYRAKLAATPDGANQLILHKNIKVNGKIVHSPGYLVQVGDEVTICDKLHNNEHVQKALKSPERSIPGYIESHGTKFKLIGQPNTGDIPLATKIDLSMIVEKLSR